MARRDDLDIDLELFEEEAQKRKAEQQSQAQGQGSASGATIDHQPKTAWGERLKNLLQPKFLWVLLIPVVLVVAYYGIGLVLVHRINDDPDFGPAAQTQKGSLAVDMAVALIEREVEHTAWTPNDPWFLPGSIPAGMQNYQRGTLYAVRIFVDQMRQGIGRARGSSVEDTGLSNAWSRLSISPNRWVFDISAGFMPQRAAEQEYLDARDLLVEYNQRVASGAATFEARSDNLIGLLGQIRNDLGAASAASNEVIRRIRTTPIIDGDDDHPARDYEVFYRNKGMIYGYYRLLSALDQDFQRIIDQREARGLWDSMMADLETAARLKPLLVMSGKLDGMAFPNHLAAQGFFLLRARSQMVELMDLLAK